MDPKNEQGESTTKTLLTQSENDVARLKNQYLPSFDPSLNVDAFLLSPRTDRKTAKTSSPLWYAIPGACSNCIRFPACHRQLLSTSHASPFLHIAWHPPDKIPENQMIHKLSCAPKSLTSP